MEITVAALFIGGVIGEHAFIDGTEDVVTLNYRVRKI